MNFRIAKTTRTVKCKSEWVSTISNTEALFFNHLYTTNRHHLLKASGEESTIGQSSKELASVLGLASLYNASDYERLVSCPAAVVGIVYVATPPVRHIRAYKFVHKLFLTLFVNLQSTWSVNNLPIFIVVCLKRIQVMFRLLWYLCEFLFSRIVWISSS